MKSRVVTTAIGAAALAVGVMWTTPPASASDFCNSLPPTQIHDCTCGAENVPGTQEYQDCLHGNAAPKPAPAEPPAPSP